MVHKSMKEIYEEKVRRNKLILENLNTPKTPEELTEIVYPKLKKTTISEKKEFRNKEKNIYNDLKFLRDLNIIDYDEKIGTYQIAGIRKKEFPNQAQLDMAIRHAKNLIIENNSVASLFGTSSIVDCLAFEGSRGLNKRNQILDHLKTGYPEIYENLIEYGKMVNESDYIPDCLKTVPIQPAPVGSLELPKHIALLKEKLVGQFEVRIMDVVKEGQPLFGDCEQCPDKRFKILK